MVSGSKVQKLVLADHGSFLGMEKGCFIVRDREGNSKRYPLFEKEIGEVVLRSGNSVSTGALASFGFWDIDVLICTGRGRPVAMLKGLDDDSHVETRLAQYEAIKNGKGIEIAKKLVLAKMEGQNIVLRKYGFKLHSEGLRSLIEKVPSDDLKTAKQKLISIERKFSEQYLSQIFGLFKESLRPSTRKTYLAYDGLNNIFNLCYEVLSWKVHKALVRAKLEPYLGFLHSIQYGKPSLVCDFQELYRYLIDDFLIGYCEKLRKKDFTVKTETLTRGKTGKREYLNDFETGELMRELDLFFEGRVEIPRIRVGQRQTFETLINEEALLFAKYLRGELDQWTPRIEVH